MAKNVVKKSVNVDEIKAKVFSDLSMMSGIKLKGIDSTANELIVKCKSGTTKVTSGQDSTVIESKPRFIPIWIWDIVLDRTKTKKVHNKVLQIITAS